MRIWKENTHSGEREKETPGRRKLVEVPKAQGSGKGLR
jgi:hypothetical protein